MDVNELKMRHRKSRYMSLRAKVDIALALIGLTALISVACAVFLR
jgi:hypothetical protein